MNYMYSLLYFVIFGFVLTFFPLYANEISIDELALSASEYHVIQTFCFNYPIYDSYKPYKEHIYKYHKKTIDSLSNAEYARWKKLKSESDHKVIKQLFNNPIVSKNQDSEVSYTANPNNCATLIRRSVDRLKNTK